MAQSGHRGTKPGEEHDDVPAQASSVNPAVLVSLLTALLANPLDAGYEHHQADHGLWLMGPANRIVVLAVAVALGFGPIIATDSLRRPASDVKVDLKEQAATWLSNIEALSDELQSLGRAIDDLSQSGSPIPVGGARDLMMATRPVSGSDITITLMDRSDPGKGSGAVRDQDVAMVVNVLWTAGAEVISVNGQCIGPDTLVRTVGVAILVNMTPVSSSCEVMVVGNSDVLFVAFARGVTGDYLFAVQSTSGMIMSSKVSQSLSMEALAPSSLQYTQLLDTQPEGDTQ